MALDPVYLISGDKLPPEWFRCSVCGARSLFAVPLPTGGVHCASCGATVRATERIKYAGPQARAIAFLADIAALFIPLVFVGVITALSFPLVFGERFRSATRAETALLNGVVASCAFAVGWFLEARGVTYGKRVSGLRVIRGRTWARPGVVTGFVRLTAKALTIATLGLGLVPILIDPERRALHDWIAGTRVIED